MICKSACAQHSCSALMHTAPQGVWNTGCFSNLPVDTEVGKRQKDKEARRRMREARRAKQAGVSITVNAGADASSAPSTSAQPSAAVPAAVERKPAVDGPIAFLFPGQGSQAVGMLKVGSRALPAGCWFDLCLFEAIGRVMTLLLDTSSWPGKRFVLPHQAPICTGKCCSCTSSVQHACCLVHIRGRAFGS